MATLFDLKHYEAIMKYVSNGPLLVDVNMNSPGKISKNFMDALLAFWPGLQARDVAVGGEGGMCAGREGGRRGKGGWRRKGGRVEEEGRGRRKGGREGGGERLQCVLHAPNAPGPVG